MTTRERTALGLLLAGAVAVVVAAYGYDGWRAAVATAGVLALVTGLLLGMDDGAPVAPGVPDGLELLERGPEDRA